MDFRSFFLGLLGVTYVCSARNTPPQTTSTARYLELFDDLLDKMPRENRAWWIRQIQVGDARKTKRLTKSEIATKINMFNSARATVIPPAPNMIALTYNLELEEALVKFRNANNGSMFYSLKHNFSSIFVGRNVNLLGAHLLRLPEFANFTDCDYFWHDTSKDNEKGENQVLRMRLNQKIYFKYSSCNRTTYNDFLSCTPFPEFTSTGKSSFTNRYYVRFINPLLKSFAVLRLKIPGAFTPNFQAGATWYYACSIRKFTPHVNDIPYEVGPRASECPAEFPIAKSGLCARPQLAGRRILMHE